MIRAKFALANLLSHLAPSVFVREMTRLRLVNVSLLLSKLSYCHLVLYFKFYYTIFSSAQCDVLLSCQAQQLRQTVGGIRLISALTVELDGAQTSFAKLQFHTISPAAQTQSEISGHLPVLLNSFPSVDIFEVRFSGCFEHHINSDGFLIFHDSFNLLPSEIARKCTALQVASGEVAR